MRRNNNEDRREIIYVSPDVTEEVVKKIRTWMQETETKIIHNYDFATIPEDVFQLFDRGYEIQRNGKFSSEAYRELKEIVNITFEDRIGDEFFEDLEGNGLVEKNILDYEDEDDEE